MKEFCKKTMFLLLTVFLSLAIFGCGETTDNQATTANPEETSIVGEYIIDITDLGMPLQFYLKIEADDTFMLSPDRTFETDKGHGTVGNSGDTYMFIYSDSTADNPNTTTFTVENNNLHFSTTLGYGSSNLHASVVDENDPDITYYLVAKVLMYEDCFGEYGGTHTVTAMGSEVVYDYSIVLGEGREFSFVSNFFMMGTDYTYTESGFYDLDGMQITLKMEDEDNVVGNFDSNNNLTIPIKPSDRGDREERTLQVATTAACSGTYYGYTTKSMGQTLMYDAELVLVLDKYGGYIYTANDSVNGNVNETGSFTVDGTTLSFTPATSNESYAGTIENYKVTSQFLVSSQSDTRAEVSLNCEIVQGTFTATGEDDAETEYDAELVLNSDGTFTFVITDDQQTDIVNATGTFAVVKTMFTQLVLTASDETVYTCVISEVGLNINIDVTDEVEVGFILLKE